MKIEKESKTEHGSLAKYAVGASFLLLAAILAVTLFYLSADLPSVSNHSGPQKTLKTDPPGLTFDKKEVASWNLFGTPTRSATGSYVPKTKTDLPIELLGTFLDQHSKMRWAILKEKNKEELSYELGQRIKENITITEINPHSIVINNNGTLERVSLREFSTENSKKSQVSIKSDEKANDAKDDRHVTELSTRENLLRTYRLKPVNEGSASGYIVLEKAEKIQEKFGLKPGDVILSANGYPLGEESSDMMALKAYQDLKSAEIVVKRKDQLVTVSYPP